jgi:hypothetical protein
MFINMEQKAEKSILHMNDNGIHSLHTLLTKNYTTINQCISVWRCGAPPRMEWNGQQMDSFKWERIHFIYDTDNGRLVHAGI